MILSSRTQKQENVVYEEYLLFPTEFYHVEDDNKKIVVFGERVKYCYVRIKVPDEPEYLSKTSWIAHEGEPYRNVKKVD